MIRKAINRIPIVVPAAGQMCPARLEEFAEMVGDRIAEHVLLSAPVPALDHGWAL